MSVQKPPTPPKLVAENAIERNGHSGVEEPMIMDDDTLTVGELREAIDGVSDDTQVNIQMGGALGEATDVYRNIEGVNIKGR